MGDRYIIMCRQLIQHEDLAVATAEHARLCEKFGRPYKIYRIKTSLQPSGAYDSLLTAAKTALAIAESHIRSDHEGTEVFDRMMGALEPVRAAIVAVGGEL